MNHYVFAGLDRESRDEQTKGNHRDHFMADLIMQSIDSTFGIEKSVLTSKLRRRHVVDARQMFCAMMRQFSTLSLTAIGKTIARDHSTVVHSIKQHNIKLEYDSAYGHGYTELLDSITNEIQYRNAKEKY